MKTYEETVQHLASLAFSDYMGGSHPMDNGECMTAYIFMKSGRQVNADVSVVLGALQDAHYAQFAIPVVPQ